MPYDSEDDADPMWFDESVWLEPYRLPFINAQAPIQQLPPQFIHGHRFATYPAHPALQALLPRYIPLPLTPSLPRVPFVHAPLQHQHSPSPEHPATCSPLLMVLQKEVFLPYFPDLLAEEVLKEFSRPPYPKYVTKLLTADFLRILTDQGPVSIQPVTAESVPVHAPVPAPELEESSVIIE